MVVVAAWCELHIVVLRSCSCPCCSCCCHWRTVVFVITLYCCVLFFVSLFLFLLLLLLLVVCSHRLLLLGCCRRCCLSSSACHRPPLLVAITVYCCFALFCVVSRCFVLSFLFLFLLSSIWLLCPFHLTLNPLTLTPNIFGTPEMTI